MIIRNLIVGCDRYGHDLKCGDICKYKIADNKFTWGMIFYSEEDYAFAFEQLDDKFPVLLMSRAELDTIEKISNCEYLNDEFPDKEKWIEIFQNNLFK
jgi:hypothetical protein